MELAQGLSGSIWNEDCLAFLLIDVSERHACCRLRPPLSHQMVSLTPEPLNLPWTMESANGKRAHPGTDEQTWLGEEEKWSSRWIGGMS